MGAALPALNFLNLTDKQLDKPIYRIMKEEHVIGLFTEKQNVLSQVHNWKDKFENFQLALGGILDGERFDFGFKSDFVGQCWTTDYLSEAMWAFTPMTRSSAFSVSVQHLANCSPRWPRPTRRCRRTPASSARSHIGKRRT